MRGDTSRAFGPNTGTICRFSVRYWMNTTPRLNGSAKGASTTIFAAGWAPAVSAMALDVHRTAIATIMPWSCLSLLVRSHPHRRRDRLSPVALNPANIPVEHRRASGPSSTSKPAEALALTIPEIPTARGFTADHFGSRVSRTPGCFK